MDGRDGDPADKSQNGVGSELADRNQEQLRSIVTGSPADSQIGAFYASYMDETRLEPRRTPLKADLDRVAAIKTKAEFASRMASTFSDFGPRSSPPGCRSRESDHEHRVRRDVRNGLAGPRLLPARQVQAAAGRLSRLHRAHVRPDRRPNAAAADQVLAFETEIARLSWARPSFATSTSSTIP